MAATRLNTPLHVAAQIILETAAWALLAFRVDGLKNLPRQGGAIVAANHKSVWDPLLLAMALSRLRRPYFVAKAELFHNKMIGWLLAGLGSVPIRRQQSDLGALRALLGILKRGDVLAIFPEGTRKKQNQLFYFLPGVGFLAQKAKVPIVPVFISDFGHCPKPGGEVRIKIGAPLEPGQWRHLEPQEIAQVALNAVRRLADKDKDKDYYENHEQCDG